jgi:hypothetical protein
MHEVPGVTAVTLQALVPYADGPLPPDSVPAALPAFGARRDAQTAAVVPAELLLINPAAIEVTEMTA